MKVGVWLNDPLNFPPSLSQRFQSILLLNKFQIPGLFHVQLGELTPQTLTTTKMISQSFLRHLSTLCLIYPQILLLQSHEIPTFWCSNIPPLGLLSHHPWPVPRRPLLRWPFRPSMAPAACGTCASQEPSPRPTWPGDVDNSQLLGKTMPCLPSSHHHRFIGYIGGMVTAATIPSHGWFMTLFYPH